MIHDYVDGVLDARRRESADTHLGRCAGCAQELRDLRGVGVLLDEMSVVDAPAGFADRVVARLKASGRIVEPVPVTGGLFATNRFRFGLAGAMLVLLAVLVFPSTVGLLEGMVGKGTVLVTDAYLEVQETAADAAVFTRVLHSMEKNLGTLKTILAAGFSLLARAGEVLFVPAMTAILLLALGVLFFLRASHRRSAEHAIYSL